MSTETYRSPGTPLWVPDCITGDQAPRDAGPFEELAPRACVVMAAPTGNLVLQRVAPAEEYNLPNLGSASWTTTAGSGGHISISDPVRFNGEGADASGEGRPVAPLNKVGRRLPWEPE